MNLMTAQEAANIWGISKRRVTALCEAGRIINAQKLGNNWVMPKNTEKPADQRITSGKYIKSTNENIKYILKQYNNVLMHFELLNEFDGLTAKITNINDANRHLLPLDLELTDRGLLSWLKSRIIPQNRAYVENFLAKLGLNEKDSKGIIDICKGLSLTDSYWTPAESFTGDFTDHNLFDNRFSNTLASISFTGLGSVGKNSFHSSPEFTTNGMLAKCWRRIDGKIILYKSGSEGAANLGKEPFSEYYAYQIANTMGLKAEEYNLSSWKNRLCSTCEIFTNISTSFIPIGKLVTSGVVRQVLEYYKNLGPQFYDEVVDMLIFDAVICNTDRHFGNFGLLIDNKSNKIISTAPIFDNGISLFCYAMEDDFENIDKYAATRRPATYPDFISFAKELITERQKEQLAKLDGFKFKKHKRYNMHTKRLKHIEIFIQNRVQSLLK